MNKVLIMGRLTKEPFIKEYKSGKRSAWFTIAIESGYGKSKTTDFVPVIVWDNLVGLVQDHLKKGERVLVEGAFTSNTYQKDGSTVTTHQVQGWKIELIELKKHKKETIKSEYVAPPKTPEKIKEEAKEAVPWEL